MAIQFAQLDPNTLPFVHEQIVNVYYQAFHEPPYYKQQSEARAFAAILSHHAKRAGFRCLVAREETTQQVLGFAYGYTGAAGQRWHDLVVQAMEQKAAAYWMSDVFEVAEIAVHPEAQSIGIGRVLHDTLLRNLPHRTAALSTYQIETIALKMYQKRGWITLLSNFFFPGYTEPYRIMGRQLQNASTRSS